MDSLISEFVLKSCLLLAGQILSQVIAKLPLESQLDPTSFISYPKLSPLRSILLEKIVLKFYLLIV